MLGITFVLGAAIVVWTVVLVARNARERARQKTVYLHYWAQRNGWTYVPEDPSLVHRFGGHPFGQGSARRATNVLTGTRRRRQFLGFEYQYTVSNGQHGSTTHHFLVMAIPTPQPRPYLQVTHETAGHKFLELFGVRDLQLESEEFNRVFRISTGNDRFAYDILHPRMMQWLLADQRSRTVPFRFEGSALLCWSSGEMDPRHVIWMSDYLADIADRVPTYVWQ